MANGEPEMFFILQLKDDDVTRAGEWVGINRSRALKGKAKSKKNYNRRIESPCINRDVFSTRESFTTRLRKYKSFEKSYKREKSNFYGYLIYILVEYGCEDRNVKKFQILID